MNTENVASTNEQVNRSLLPQERRIIRRARLLARKHGMVLRKSRRKFRNAGHYRLTATTIIAGDKFELTPEDIIRICEAAEKSGIEPNEPEKISIAVH